jgi:RND family efflux transporter MFP subunit
MNVPMIRRMTAFAFLSLLPLALAACGGSADSETHGTETGPPVRVRTAPVVTAFEPVGVDVSGQVVARNRVDVASRLAGRVTELPVREGTMVREGDLLARVDAPELTAALQQAQAAEAAAQSAVEVAVRQAERMERLAAKEVVTPRDYELADLGRKDAEASFQRARAARVMAENNLRYAVIRAPLDGVVVRRYVRVGDLAVPGKPLLSLEDTAEHEVRITVPAEAVVTPRADMRATITTRDGRTVTAHVDRVVPSADAHTMVAYLQTEGIDRPSGSYVQAHLFGETQAEAIRVPEEALVRRGPLTGVFVVSDGRAVLRWLRLAEDGRVLAGLAEGEEIVLGPSSELQDGSRVEVSR